jgi:DNA-binding CsgD family transcriptional regulator
MFNHNFIQQFSQNFISQIQYVIHIDGFLTYKIDNIQHAYDFEQGGISKSAIDEYLNGKIEYDPVSFRHFYHGDQNIALLGQYQPNEIFLNFMQRWQVEDTAEFFFRKRDGQPIFGLSIFREQGKAKFNQQEKKIFEAFHRLSIDHFHHHVDMINKDKIMDQYQLTKKEIVVLEELFTNLEAVQISQKLNCSLSTIKTHVQHIYQKLNVNSRQELVCKLIR